MGTLEKAPKTKSKKEKLSASTSDRLKVIVRRLPPNLPEDVFWTSVTEWVSEETTTWKIFYPGKLRKKMNKENIPSRAYVAFRDDEQLATFSREYDGHLFRDKAGNESQAIVEFAPYQKLPTEKRKVDARNATIEKDEDFISFLASLEAAANAEQPTLEALIAANQPPPRPTTTPLLEALKAAQSARMDKEAILRAHMHYKDPNQRYKDGAKPPAAAASASGPAKGGKGSAKAAARAAQGKPGHNSNQQANNGGGAAGSSKGAGKEPATPKKNKKGGNNPNSNNNANPNANVNAPGGPAPPKAIQQKGPVAANAGGSNAKLDESSGPSRRITRAAQGKPQKNQQPTSAVVVPGSAGAGSTPASEFSLPPPAAPAQARRTRPVIGIASRQFQGALSGAGVRGGGGGKKEGPKTQQGVKAPSILQRGEGSAAPMILQRDGQGQGPHGGGPGKKGKTVKVGGGT